MTDDQIAAAADRLPITMDALEIRGYIDDENDDEGDEDDEFGHRCRKAYGKGILILMEDYHYAKNWQEYHHCGIFVMLYHCASQIPIHDDNRN